MGHLLGFFSQAVINIKEVYVYVYHTRMCMFENYFLCPLSSLPKK